MSQPDPIQIRCKAFSGTQPAVHSVLVDDLGAVRVYDPVARYYTTCHVLGSRECSRIIAAWNARPQCTELPERPTTADVLNAPTRAYTAACNDTTDKLARGILRGAPAKRQAL